MSYETFEVIYKIVLVILLLWWAYSIGKLSEIHRNMKQATEEILRINKWIQKKLDIPGSQD